MKRSEISSVLVINCWVRGTKGNERQLCRLHTFFSEMNLFVSDFAKNHTELSTFLWLRTENTFQLTLTDTFLYSKKTAFLLRSQLYIRRNKNDNHKQYQRIINHWQKRNIRVYNTDKVTPLETPSFLSQHNILFFSSILFPKNGWRWWVG